MAGKNRRAFGRIERLGSGRYRAAYTGPDTALHRAPRTFQSKDDAVGWLNARRREIDLDVWEPPSRAIERRVLFGAFATAWLADRPLKDRTRAHYRQLLSAHILPTFADIEVGKLSLDAVRVWYGTLLPNRPTMRAHAYALLRTIMGTAVERGLVEINPCKIRGAGQSKTVRKVEPLTLIQLEVLVEAMPGQYRALALVAAWAALRFGECAELRRMDIDLTHGVIRVRRAVVRVDRELRVTTPKSAAGIRDVAIPPHLLPILADHLDTHVEGAAAALVFPGEKGGHLSSSHLYRWFHPAREAAGRPDLRFHDLRHTGATLAAQTGATLAELMSRLGHSTPQAALRYQHASADRDLVIAEALSKMAGFDSK